MTTHPMPNTLKENEIYKFDALADDWWQESGSFYPLHHMNPCRLSFICTHITRFFPENCTDFLPFSSLKILDVGCGGGILTEPLARLGATVTGLDASAQAIHVARAHSQQSDLSIEYHQGCIEDFHITGFDVVCALEILEHVDNPQYFLKECLRTLKPGGLFFISTLNKTYRSFLEAIVVAEYLLKWAPKDTHNWHLFFKPHVLVSLIEPLGGKVLDIKGMAYHPFKRCWELVGKPQTNYIMVFQKTSL